MRDQLVTRISCSVQREVTDLLLYSCCQQLKRPAQSHETNLFRLQLICLNQFIFCLIFCLAKQLPRHSSSFWGAVWLCDYHNGPLRCDGVATRTWWPLILVDAVLSWWATECKIDMHSSGNHGSKAVIQNKPTVHIMSVTDSSDSKQQITSEKEGFQVCTAAWLCGGTWQPAEHRSSLVMSLVLVLSSLGNRVL